MADHNICDACETVIHCRKNGCIPITPLAAPGAPSEALSPATVAWQYRRNYRDADTANDFDQWSGWRNAAPVDLDTFQRRAKEDPGMWQVRELIVKP